MPLNLDRAAYFELLMVGNTDGTVGMVSSIVMVMERGDQSGKEKEPFSYLQPETV